MSTSPYRSALPAATEACERADALRTGVVLALTAPASAGPEGLGATRWCSADRVEDLAMLGEAQRVDADGVGRFAALSSALRGQPVVVAGIGGVPPRRPRWWGAFAFEPNAPCDGPFAGWPSARLVLPSRTVGRDRDGGFEQRCVVVAPGSTPSEVIEWLSVPVLASLGSAAAAPAAAPGADEDDFVAETRRALEWIERGEAQKIVVARAAPFAGADAPHAVAQRLVEQMPGCYVFAFDGPGGTAFVGASPELLLARTGDRIRSMALAGTAPRPVETAQLEPAERALIDSAKDRAEHGWVVRSVRATLDRFVVAETCDDHPGVVVLPNVLHLATHLSGTARPGTGTLEILAALHPTPAVGGWPHEAARRFLASGRGGARGQYAGPVGWVDDLGDCTFAVGLRSALVGGGRALLFAGAGIVAGSVPERELAETRVKMQAVGSALCGRHP